MQYKCDLSTWIPHHFIWVSTFTAILPLPFLHPPDNHVGQLPPAQGNGKRKENSILTTVIRNVLSEHLWRQKANRPHASTSLQRISGSLTLRKLQTARGRDHSCSEASKILIWVSPFPAVFSERKKSFWNTEFKLILPSYTFWIIPDEPAKKACPPTEPLSTFSTGHKRPQKFYFEAH